MVAAVGALVGGAISTGALAFAPEPTGLTKAAAIGSAIATVGALAWVISALIALIECLEKSGTDAETLNELRAELERLEARLEELEGN